MGIIFLSRNFLIHVATIKKCLKSMVFFSKFFVQLCEYIFKENTCGSNHLINNEIKGVISPLLFFEKGTGKYSSRENLNKFCSAL
jgi:hypothetical protein